MDKTSATCVSKLDRNIFVQHINLYYRRIFFWHGGVTSEVTLMDMSKTDQLWKKEKGAKRAYMCWDNELKHLGNNAEIWQLHHQLFRQGCVA